MNALKRIFLLAALLGMGGLLFAVEPYQTADALRIRFGLQASGEAPSATLARGLVNGTNGLVVAADAITPQGVVLLTSSNIFAVTSATSTTEGITLSASSGQLTLSRNPLSTTIDPQSIILNDRFYGTGTVAYNTSRTCQPGPGTLMSGMSPGSGGSVYVNDGEVLLSNTTGNGSTSLKYVAGVSATNGVTVIASGVVSSVNNPGLQNIGVILDNSSSPTSTNGSGGFISIASSNANPVSTLAIRQSDGVGQAVYQYAYRAGDSFAFAVKNESGTSQSYWAQGGLFSQFGAVVDSSIWFPVGISSNTNSTVYPTIYTQGATAATHWNHMSILSSWSPAKESPNLWDFSYGKENVAVPMIAQLSDSRLVIAWNNGSGGFTHPNDNIIRAVVRGTDGTWGQPQTIIPNPGSGMSSGEYNLSRVGSDTWLVYGTGTFGGSDRALHYKLLTAGTDGTIALGSEQSFSGITGVYNSAMAFGRIYQRNGRTFMGFANGTAGANSIYVAYSDDLNTWTAIAIPVSTSYAAEPCVIGEPNGNLVCFIRTGNYVYYMSESSDNGVTWSTPIATAIPCPSGVGWTGARCLVRQAPDGNIALIGNDDYAYRRRVTVWLLGNSGKVLHKELLGDLGNDCHMMYPDIFFDGENALYAWSFYYPVTGGAPNGGVASAIGAHSRKWVTPISVDAGGTGKSTLPINYNIPTQIPGGAIFGGPTATSGVITLTSGTSISTNCALGDMYIVTLGTNATLATPTTPLPWQSCTWFISQDATGGRVLTLGTAFSTGGATYTNGTAAGSTDIIRAIYNPIKQKFQVYYTGTGY